MSWTNKYWDLIDHLYWAPQYLGLKSIPQRHWETNGDRVSVPKAMTNPKGPLYRRLRSGEDYQEYVRRQEETFNHIFDLTFSILPGDVVGEIFDVHTGTTARHCYDSFGREFHSRYGWGEHDNITTPDGLFLAKDAVLAVELKFNAKTSRDQLAKYLGLLAAEESVGGKRANLDLLYVFNSNPELTFEKQVGFKPQDICAESFTMLLDAVHNETLTRSLIHQKDHVTDVLKRLRISCITWQEMLDGLVAYSSALGETPGDRTMRRLIDGFVLEISNHPLSNAFSEK